MKSRIYAGTVMHARLAPVSHRFTYPVYFYVFDLDELPALDAQLRWFGYNRKSIVAIHDRDYLNGQGPIREQFHELLGERVPRGEIARVELLTMARYFNYIFNPVSFYYAYRDDGTMRCVVAEVNNTFNERHFYILDQPQAGAPDGVAAFTHLKEFHVSPFNDRRGEYAFRFTPPGTTVRVEIDLRRGGEKIMEVVLAGQQRPLDAAHLRHTLLEYPVTAALNMPRIIVEAAKLYYKKKLPVFHKPPPASPLTRPAPPTRLEKWARSLILGFFDRIARGVLRFELPDGTVHECRGGAPGSAHTLRIRECSFFSRMLRDGDVGFGETFMEGIWDCDDLPGLMHLLADNAEALDDRAIRLSWLGRAANRIRHEWRRNSLLGSRRNIQAHYDLGNDFYRLFLDETMLYSAALYRTPGETLTEAQINKLHRLIEKARLEPSHHILEIGSGWGAFAIEAARASGCRVTSITLSEEQLKLARERAEKAGVADRVHFEICDYRAVQGAYDRIVSIEMLEAVGHEYLGCFFEACERVLKPEGWVVLQVITIPDQRYDAYRRSTDWIQKHIFPGGVLPSLTALSQAMTRHSNLVVESLENIGPHYAPTLREWRRRFEAHHDELLQLGYDETFQRKWRYYFSYCEAGFATRLINDLHLVLTRPHNGALNQPALALPGP